MNCPSCQLSVIQGAVCHEHGCPDSHLFTKRDCKWCGSEFKPETKESKFCSMSCECCFYDQPEEGDYEQAVAKAEYFHDPCHAH